MSGKTGFTKESLDLFLQEKGKRFVYDSGKLKFRGKHSRLKEFVDALQKSVEVETLFIEYLDTKDDWINFLDLVDKVPKCNKIKLANSSIDENNTTYLAKLITICSTKRYRGRMILKSVSFCAEACQTIADLVNPNRVILNLVHCQLPTIAPFIESLSKTTNQNHDINYDNSLNDLLRMARSWNDNERNAMIDLANTKKVLSLRKQSSRTVIQIAQIIRDSDNLEKLTCQDCDFGLNAATALAEAMQVDKAKPLSDLELHCPSLNFKSMVALCTGIKRRMTDLSLRVVSYKDRLEPIAELLENNKLCELELICTTKYPVTNVINALKKNTSLKKLNIYLGPFQDNGEQQKNIQALTDALIINKTLRSLTVLLDGEEKLDALVSTIVNQTKLTSLCINGGVPLSYDYGQLCNILKKGRYLERFSIRQALVEYHDPKITEKLMKSMEDSYSLLSFQYLNGYWVPKEIMEKYKERNLGRTFNTWRFEPQ